MRVEVHDGLKNPQNISATRLVVYDEFDNPIAAIVQIGTGQYVATTASQKQFKNVLKALGITKTLVIDHLDPKQLPPLE
jgi:hypothetical protein